MVHADAATVAFLDHRPLLPGHTLVIPRAHHRTLDDLPADAIGPLFAAVQLLSRAMPVAFGADGSFVAVNTRVSQSLPHVHVHVVPRKRGDGLFRAGMVWKRLPYPDRGEVDRVRVALADAVARFARSYTPERT